MTQKRIITHLRIHRKNSGLTQLELARLVGHKNGGRVSRHELGISLPSLVVALSYEAIFGIPISELFPAVHETLAKQTTSRLAELESILGRKSAKDRDANATACKLQFILQRKTDFKSSNSR
jgi:DNA-binding XRE family transcriptional regulator